MKATYKTNHFDDNLLEFVTNMIKSGSATSAGAEVGISGRSSRRLANETAVSVSNKENVTGITVRRFVELIRNTANELITTKNTAQLLNCSPSTVRKYTAMVS